MNKSKPMFIKKEDYKYLEVLCQSLDGDTRERFLKILTKSASVRAGEDVLSKIRVVGDEIVGERGTDPSEWVTRTMIKKAYKEAKK